MSYTQVTLDKSGRVDLLPPDTLLPENHIQDEDIAPWTKQLPDDPVLLPGNKSSRSFGFSSKSSFSSFSSFRNGSTTTLRNSFRASDAPSIAESSSSIYSNDSTIHSQKLKSSKSMFTKFIRRSRSQQRLRTDSHDSSSSPPPLPDFVSFLPLPSPPSPTHKREREKSRGKKKGSAPTNLSFGSYEFEPDSEINLDINNMKGIIDDGVLVDSYHPDHPTQSIHSEDGFSHSIASTSSLPIFSNPFNPSASLSAPSSIPPHFSDHHHRRVSPKTITPMIHTPPKRSLDGVENAWTAPESWAVEKEGQVEETPASSSDEAETTDRPSVLHPGLLSHVTPKKPRPLRRPSRQESSVVPEKIYKVRIYRANNQYHVVSMNLNHTVADLTPRLKGMLSESDRETHRLYLKERGRERVLGQSERPADIVRRRLEQAGYDAGDGLELMAEDGLPFLLKLVYKSQLLGPAEEEQTFRSFEKIDLNGRGLRTVPVALHAHADSINSLNLSRNPMVEIPLDFVQSCTNLRELLLLNMAMKKVPHSIQHSTTLRHLNIACNRIADLDDAGLDKIPGLHMLRAENNRMEKLPWYFARMQNLQVLNISNNKFKHLPAVVCEMSALVELDISFNLISELPEEIGQLRCLQQFIIVGNQVSRFPEECASMHSLSLLDCRRNTLTDVSKICLLPKLEILRADYNSVHALNLTLGPCLRTLELSHNQITQITVDPTNTTLYTLITLDISHAKLAHLDDIVLTQLTSLQVLKLDHNQLQSLPETLGELSYLRTLSCSNNRLKSLPSTIGSLQKLETLDAHTNDLDELPIGLWNCGSLLKLNITSNLLVSIHDPPPHNPTFVLGDLSSNDEDSDEDGSPRSVLVASARRKGSAATIGGSRYLPPLAHSLEKLYLGENRLTDEVLYPLTVLKELRILNLSFNDVQELPPPFFKYFPQLEELYLSGNKLSTIPTEDLAKLTRLSVLFLNGNKLQTLPQELGKVQSLTVLDVGSNILKYNINNWEFDWNWNFNKNLRYLNLSGNKRLQIKSDLSSMKQGRAGGRLSSEVNIRRKLSGFTDLQQLRVLGLMDVTITTTTNNMSADIPDEHEDRRVRTSSSMVSGMPYGIADNLGQHEHLNMFDLVHEFRGTDVPQAIFAMFGQAQPVMEHNNRLSKYLYDQFLNVFSPQVNLLKADQKDRIKDTLRRAFLDLNKDLHNYLYSASSSRKMSQASASTIGTSKMDAHHFHHLHHSASPPGVAGVVVYVFGKTLFVANVGNMLAVVSRRGDAHAVSQKHDPFERSETARIRAAEGWVSSDGRVNGETEVSRSFGLYHLLPIVNARPYIQTYELNELDEFVIIGNRGLWDHVSYQTAVDIARDDPTFDPQIIAQKLRDFAISYGAEGSTMIMVVGLGQQNTNTTLTPPKRSTGKKAIADRGIARLPEEVDAPQGHLALVFTDIRNSTHLWEVNPGMPAAMRIHNNVFRRALRLCGGYEVKTEGDAFMCSFPTTLGAVWFCLSVQVQLLKESWPLEILECEDGKEIFDDNGNLVARGLSVRMGIHCGSPLCERDPNTNRMDYFGPVVNRSARINGSAAGGQIMCSADVVREINAKIYKTEPETEYSAIQPQDAVEAIKLLEPVIIPMGEHKLKGLEVPELLSAMYPKNLVERHMLKEPKAGASVSGSRVQFSVSQMRELGTLCLRLEALSSSRVFRDISVVRKASVDDSSGATQQEEDDRNSVFLYGDPRALLPAMDVHVTDADLMSVLDHLSVRIENALASLSRRLAGTHQDLGCALLALVGKGKIDESTMRELLAVLGAQ